MLGESGAVSFLKELTLQEEEGKHMQAIQHTHKATKILKCAQ